MSLPRRIVHFVSRRNDKGAVEQAARDIAWECYPPLMGRMLHQGPNMGRDRLRGYVRAYAAALVAAEVDTAMKALALATKLRAQLASSAVEQLINLVVSDLLRAGGSSGGLAAAA